VKLKTNTLYRRRDGVIIGPLRRRRLTRWPWITKDRLSFTDDGRFGFNPNIDSAFDIIEEVQHAVESEHQISAA
jgi:hypothetical protein